MGDERLGAGEEEGVSEVCWREHLDSITSDDPVNRVRYQLWTCHQERGIDPADDLAVKRSRPQEGDCDG